MTTATREQLQEWGRKGGQVRAAQASFRDHQSRAGKRCAEVVDMAALGHRGARAFIARYGYVRFFCFWRQWKLANPSSHEKQVAAILDALGYRYEREAQVLGESIPVAVDFYLADANDSVIEVNGRVHYDPMFDHPNAPATRLQSDEARRRRLERAGLRVLVIDYRELRRESAVRARIIEFLMS